MLDRIARALMLTDVEREHLFLLGLGRPPEVRYRKNDGVTPRLQRVLAVKPATVNLSVTADGTLHWNDDIIDAQELDARLKVVAAEQPQPEILIRGDRKVEYEHVIRGMAAVQQAGVLKLGFVTEPVR